MIAIGIGVFAVITVAGSLFVNGGGH